MENSDIVSLFQEVGRLKDINRAGWERVGISNPESVADHSFRCTFMAMILGDKFDVDFGKLLKMALIHDIAEIKTGDITPHDGISQKEKQKKEQWAVKEILSDLPNLHDYLELWTEYEEQKSKEARIIRNLDKFEMALTAVEYQNENPDLNLKEFIEEAERQIDILEISKLFTELKKQVKATSQ
jgi:5'-deoxynucleotidase YfbR-like HD superfamily hydrolase